MPSREQGWAQSAGTRTAAAGGARPVFNARDLATLGYACIVTFLWAIVQRAYAAKILYPQMPDVAATFLISAAISPHTPMPRTRPS
jgi:hypothetical protein